MAIYDTWLNPSSNLQNYNKRFFSTVEYGLYMRYFQMIQEEKYREKWESGEEKNIKKNSSRQEIQISTIKVYLLYLYNRNILKMYICKAWKFLL